MQVHIPTEIDTQLEQIGVKRADEDGKLDLRSPLGLRQIKATWIDFNQAVEV